MSNSIIDKYTQSCLEKYAESPTKRELFDYILTNQGSSRKEIRNGIPNSVRETIIANLKVLENAHLIKRKLVPRTFTETFCYGIFQGLKYEEVYFIDETPEVAEFQKLKSIITPKLKMYRRF